LFVAPVERGDADARDDPTFNAKVTLIEGLRKAGLSEGSAKVN
jgi:hypothetical protein